MPLGNRKKAIRLRSVMGAVFKAELYRSLSLPRPTDQEIAEQGYPPGYVHIPDSFDDEWCKQLTAEKRVVASTGRYEWKKDHPRNEALDCWVYARACLWLAGVANWLPAKWALKRAERGLDGPERQAALPKPARTPREQAAAHQAPPAQAAPASAAAATQARPRTPREQAAFNKTGGQPQQKAAPAPDWNSLFD